jgi:hypothetical protein
MSNLRVLREMRTQYHRVKARLSAYQLWERVLSPQDRRRLGGDLEKCYAELGTVGMWMKLRRVSQVRAILELALKLGFLSQETYHWLLHEVGHKPNAQEQSDRPDWQASTGELRWKGRVIRRVRILKNPANVQTVLAKFQRANWPARIKNPLRFGQQQLHQTLRSLNERLQKIRFHGQEGGQAITWEVL